MLLQQILLCLGITALTCAAEKVHIPLELNIESDLQVVECQEFKYYQVEVTDPCKDLRVRVHSIEGEPDLYISRGNNKYARETTLAWTSYEWGSEDLTVSSWDPEFEVGTFYIAVHAYCGDDVSTDYTPSKFTVLAESVPTTHPHDEITVARPVLNQNVSAEGYLYYRFCLPSKCINAEVKLENCLDSSVCPDTYGYPELLVSRSIVRPTIKDHAWKLASLTYRSVTLRHDDPDVQPGHHYVGVYGWCTPDEFCSDRSTCGPCDHVPNMPFNVTLVMTEVANCDPDSFPSDPCSANDKAFVLLPSVTVVFLSVFGMLFFIQ